jgi:hypothetical protein
MGRSRAEKNLKLKVYETIKDCSVNLEQSEFAKKISRRVDLRSQDQCIRQIGETIRSDCLRSAARRHGITVTGLR